jgi:two-component system, chemotaxis family, sensor kinase CheA
LVQYRGHLMPLVCVNNEARVRAEGAQPMLVFSDGGRSMGLVVDEIVDIVQDRLAIEVASDTAGVIGSAVIKGKATEIIDVGHFLPLAFQDWFRRKELNARAVAQSLLLVDDAAFFRGMLPPLLQVAGYEVVTAASAQDALALLKTGRRFDVILCDLEMPGMNGLQFAQVLRADPRTALTPMIALASHAAPAMVEQAREAGYRDLVAKFDRPGLVAALKELAVDWEHAA